MVRSIGPGTFPVIGLIVALLFTAAMPGVAMAGQGDALGPAYSLAVQDDTTIRVTPSTQEQKLPALSAQDWFSIGILVGAPILLVLLWFADVIRPGSFQRCGLRQVQGHPWWVWAAAGGLIFLTGQFCGAIAYQSLGVPALIPPPLKAQVIATAASSLAGIAAGVALIRMLRAGAPQGGVALKWSDLWVGLGCMLVSYPIILAGSTLAVMLTRVITGSAPEAIAHDTLKKIAEGGNDPWAWGLRIAAVVLVPIYEELTYRVGLQSAMLRLTGKPWAAIVISSAGFTAMHYGVMPGHALVVIAILSISIGVAYERTKRLGVPIVMHALFNAANVLMVM